MEKQHTVAFKEDHLYQQVADRIERLIEDGVLRIGDKLPSVRALSQEQGISISTAFQAYYQLEGKGLIESRPKSGYYVKFSPARLPQLPQLSNTEPSENEVSVSKMIATVFKHLSSDEVLQLSVAVPSLELLPTAKLHKSVVHALHTKNHGLGYEHVQGNVDLRKQIAKMAFSWGSNLTEDDIVITAGCMEALVMCLKTVTHPGDTVAIESPTYFGIFRVIESLGLKVVEIRTDPVTGVDLDYLENAIRKFSLKACLFVPNFNNPLGSLMPDAHKKALVHLLSRYEVFLIEDDIYGELYFGKTRPKTCKTFDTEGIVLQCGSLSKSLAPGYRIGWAIPGRHKEKLVDHKLTHTVSSNTLMQEAMAHFLEHGRYDFHLKSLRKALHTQSLRYMQAIGEYFPSGTRLTRPQGGFVLWIELDKKVNTFRLHQEAIQQHISIAPGQIFSTQGKYANCMRICYGRTWDTKVEKGLETIGQLITTLLGKG